MSSSSIRFRAGFLGFLPGIIALIAALALPNGVCAAADKPVDVEGPVAATGNDGASRPANRTQAANSSQSRKSAKSEKKTEPAKKTSAVKKGAAETVGEPMAAGMMELLRDEIIAGIRNRGISDRYARFQGYAIEKLNSSAGRYTGSELAGNCRLKWYDHMMRNMLAAPAEAERFTRDLHMAVRDSDEGLTKVLAIAALKMDLSERKPRTFTPPASAQEALEVVKQALTEAQVDYCRPWRR